MSVAGTVDISLDAMGGLVLDMAPSDLPDGVSPDCQDCAFKPGAVFTRPGIGPGLFPVIAANPTLNYLKTYTQPNLTEVLLSLDSLGSLWQAQTVALAQINAGVGQAIVPGSRGKSTSIFGREYIALGDGKFGIDFPRQYDGTNLDRVSQVGPVAGPAAAADISFALTALSRTGGVISATTASAHGLNPGDLVNIAGVNADGTFNGQFPVLTVGSPTTFTAQGAPGIFVISSVSRTAGVVSAVIAGNPPTIVATNTVVVIGVSDATYNGVFALASIAGNILTWNQAGVNSVSFGGTLYTKAGSNVEPVVLAANNAALLGAPANGFVFDVPPTSNLSGFAVGDTITIAANTNVLCNITVVINIGPQVLGNGNIGFQCALQAGGSFSGTGGTATPSLPDSAPTVSGYAGPAGSISAGTHQITFTYITRQGAILKPSPPIFWAASGGFKASLTGIPIGPSNIIGRIVGFTAANGADFRYLPETTINDNTMTTFTADFADAAILAGTAMLPLFNQVELEECSGFIGYANRLVAWGLRNYVQQFLNMSFDGGFSGATPLGWTTDAVSGTGGAQESVNVWWGFAYKITGDGVTPKVGMITQGAYQDYLKTTLIKQQTAYSVRIRLLAGGSHPQGNAVVELYSPSQGSLGAFSVPIVSLPATYGEFIGPLMAAQASIPADLQLRYYLGGTAMFPPANGTYVIADNIEIFPTAQPYNATFARASGIDNPESFDGVSGLLQRGNNQAIRSAFILTDRSSLTANDHLHLVREDSIFRTQDTGGDPSTWPITQVSGTIGTPSVDGVDVGEDWVAIAHESGLYLFYYGSEPNKISQEIQPLWDRINWTGAGHTVWVRVDTLNKRILVGVPLDGALTPNKILALDYRGLISASQIIETPPVHFSAYSGKILSLGLGRKWSPWTIAANCAHYESPDAKVGFGMGGMYFGGFNGKIYNLQNAQLNDDGVAIPSYYQTYHFPSQIQEPMLKLRTHRKLFSYLTGFIEGSGPLPLTAFLDSVEVPDALPTLNLINIAAPPAITAISRVNGLLTVTCAAGHGLTAGTDLALVIAGVADASMNGALPIKQVLNPNSFTVGQATLPDSVSNGGTVARLLRDFEVSTNLTGERCSYKVGPTTQLNSWFRLQKLSPSLQNDPWAVVRGGM